MSTIQLQTASQAAACYGAKMLVHGECGMGKTPLIMTAPNPVTLVTEPGLLSVVGSNTPVFVADKISQFNDFVQWVGGSTEARQYQTVCIDSISYLAELCLLELEPQFKDGRKVYGVMADTVFNICKTLYHLKDKNVYLTAKQQAFDQGGGILKRRPFFPGQNLNSRVPYLYDFVLCLGMFSIPNAGQHKAFLTEATLNIEARARLPILQTYEQPHLGQIIDKVNAYRQQQLQQ